MPDLPIENEEVVPEEEKPTRSDNRFKDLADKVKTTAEERDQATAKATALEKELEFHKGFSKITSKFSGASDYEDKIKEKVLAGADPEEATVAILYKAGKLDMGNAPAPRNSPAGGSAATTMTSGEKELKDMSREEKREALIQLESETGAVTQMLRRGI